MRGVLNILHTENRVFFRRQWQKKKEEKFSEYNTVLRTVK